MDAKVDPTRTDVDPAETREWMEALAAVIEREGPERAHFLLEQMIDATRRQGGHLPYKATTAYVNTIPPQAEAKSPGDAAIEWRARALLRWNALAMVVRANRRPGELGGHIASFQSAATLYDVGFNHFWRTASASHPGDLVYVQGHSSPGVYARAFLEGRISAEQLDRFRMEVGGEGISSYPHPWLMPDFWQVPTVSMGLGPISAIYQARFWKYLEHRGLIPASDRKVWCFMGDGESDEPESLGAISLAGREGLDNLVFVINCNLQRLDGPVRGNGKIIQELEGVFRGAGWNAIKVIWGGLWDPLLAMDRSGTLRKLMEETVDGEYQNYKANGGAYTREHFFGKYPQTRELVSRLSDEDIARLNRGGHDPHKVYAAYAAAVAHKGQPTVILAKTVKGYGMGEEGESKNTTHQQKKLQTGSIRHFRDRFKIPVSDADLETVPYLHPGVDSPEARYLRERRAALGGSYPQRRQQSDESLATPALTVFGRLLDASGDREISTTMAFVQALNVILRDSQVGPRVVPIICDEARTFGMEGLFRQLGIYAPFGQKYRPVDADQLMYYREDQAGQVLQEGITEAGSFCSWLAAATSYSTNNLQMLPFYIFYSMFGFQRIGDLAWAAGDMRARGFLLGATSGRTTLNGEGLQHEDGHSHLMAATVPNCRAYDPTFAFEVAVILQYGMQRMLTEQRDEYYYITLLNENYRHPAMPASAAEGTIRGMYRLIEAEAPAGGLKATLLGCGSILREAIAAAELLKADYGVHCDVMSCPSLTELARDGQACERARRLHGQDATPWVTTQLAATDGPIIAATDYIRAWPEQIRAYLPEGRRYLTLGTDGYGRSDTRANLRRYFEVDRFHIAHATLYALAQDGRVPAELAADAAARYGIAPDDRHPWQH
jgi:pyruvate dehydrogenase E1 component